MKKLLFVSAIQIYPAESGGQLRSSSLCEAFSGLGFEVTIYSFTGRKQDYLKLKSSGYQSIQKSIKEYTNRSWVYAFFQWFCYRFGLPPLWITILNKIYIPGTLKQLQKSADFTIIDFPFLYPVRDTQKKPFYLNTHNAEFELVQSDSLLRKWVRTIEKKAMATSDRVLFCNDRDLSTFTKLIPQITSKSSIVPNGVNPKHFQRNPSTRLKVRQFLGIESDQKVFLFTGSQYSPNKEAFSYLENFVHHHQDKLSQFNIVILVAGTVCLETQNNKNFKVLGRVENMKDYFAAADFGLNPILLGSGTNVKMIEFLAARLPILSTQFGARGLFFEDKKSILFFERDHLLDAIEQACQMTEDDIAELTTQAWHSNQKSIDMQEALRSLEIQWC